MTATPAQLGARALRKLGIAIVADAQRPGAGPVSTVLDVAGRVMRELGVPVSDASRSAVAPPVGKAEIASRALRMVGIDPAVMAGGSFNSGAVFGFAVVAREALLKLSVIGSDETPTPADLQTAVDRVINVHNQLVELDYVTWTLDAIPSAYVEHYVTMVCNLLGPQFGRAITAETFTAAQEMIRRIALAGARGQAFAEAKVVSVHDGLNVAGVVSWTVDQVPAAHAEDYAAMTATLLGPLFDRLQDAASRGVDASEWAAAEARIRKASVIRGSFERAQDRVRAIQSELNALGLVSWDANSIPAAAADAMASMAAMQLGPEFGRPMDGKEYAALEARIRRISMGGKAGQALAEQKVRAVQASLEARGHARWSLYDIPTYAEEPIVFMAAAWLGPECGVPADPMWWQMGEHMLMQAIEVPTLYRPVMATYF